MERFKRTSRSPRGTPVTHAFSRGRRFVALISAFAFVLTTMMFTAPERGRSQANGATTTAEITLGIGVLVYLEQYFVALSKSKGSAAQADAIADAHLPLSQYAYFNYGGPDSKIPPNLMNPALAQAAAGNWTLRLLRDLIIYDVVVAAQSKQAHIPLWRGKFEHYRGCWNQVIAQPASTASTAPPSQPKAAAPSTGTPVPGGSTSPQTTTPNPADSAGKTACDLVLVDYPDLLGSAKPKIPFDATDFAGSFSDTSLYQQVLNQDVGSHALNNGFHEIFLFIAGHELTQSLVNATREHAFSPTPALGDYTSLLSACVTNAITFGGALGCISAIGGIEQTLAKAQSQRDACAFSRGMWIPRYTILTTSVLIPNAPDQPPPSPIILDTSGIPPPVATAAARRDYGPAPGC
jgi:hypothetical protein